MTRRIVFHLPAQLRTRDIYIDYEARSAYAITSYSLQRDGYIVLTRDFANLIQKCVTHNGFYSYRTMLQIQQLESDVTDELPKWWCELEFGYNYLWKEAKLTIVIQCTNDAQVKIWASAPVDDIYKSDSLLNLTWLCDMALLLFEVDVAPYVAIDIIDMLLGLDSVCGLDFATASNQNHFKKIKTVEAVQRRLREAREERVKKQ